MSPSTAESPDGGEALAVAAAAAAANGTDTAADGLTENGRPCRRCASASCKGVSPGSCEDLLDTEGFWIFTQ